jgi:protein-S-isoprenylcysteine O-methyltransferase Ste14
MLFVTDISNHNFPLAVGVIGAGLLAFSLCIITSEESHDHDSWISNPSQVRAAIAISIVVEYLVLVGIVAFFAHGAEQLPAITQTLVTNFTTVVGVVIAFFFGSSVYLQSQNRSRVGQLTDPKDRTSDSDVQKT